MNEIVTFTQETPFGFLMESNLFVTHDDTEVAVWANDESLLLVSIPNITLVKNISLGSEFLLVLADELHLVDLYTQIVFDLPIDLSFVPTGISVSRVLFN